MASLSRYTRVGPLLVAIVLGGLLLGPATVLVSDHPAHSGDTIQFQFLSETYGLPHPPGAPVYVALITAWRHLMPWATPAFAANSLSTLAGVVLLLFLARLLRRWGVPWFGVVLAALTLTTTPLWLRLSTVAELYVPMSAVALVALERAQAWVDTGRDRDLVLVGTLLGLGAGIHPTILLFGPACLLVVLQRNPVIWRERVAWNALAALVGSIALCVGWIALIVESPSTVFVWAPLEDLDSFVRFVTARTFRSDLGALDAAAMFRHRIPEYLHEVFGFSSWLLPIAVVGLIARVRSLRGAAVLAILVVNASYVVPYDVFDVWDFVLPGQVAMALWVGMGAAALRDFGVSRPGVRSGAVLVGLALALAQLTLVFDRIEGVARRTHHPGFVDRTQARLDVLDDGDVLVSPVWDDSCALWYSLLVGPSRERHVEMVHAAPPRRVRDYLVEGRALRDRNRRRWIEPGQRVFAVRDWYARLLLEQGLYLYEFGGEGEVYAVRAGRDTLLAADTDWIEHDPHAARLEYGDGWGAAENWGRWMLDPRAGVECHNLPARARLKIQASTWRLEHPRIEVEVLLDGDVVSTFEVTGKPWKPSIYEFTLPNERPRERARITLQVGELHQAPGDRPRALPVQSIEIGPGRLEGTEASPRR